MPEVVLLRQSDSEREMPVGGEGPAEGLPRSLNVITRRSGGGGVPRFRLPLLKSWLFSDVLHQRGSLFIRGSGVEAEMSHENTKSK